MAENFEITNSILVNYHGSDEVVTLPDCVTEIGERAFVDCKTIVR